jgi:hypothetical protein
MKSFVTVCCALLLFGKLPRAGAQTITPREHASEVASAFFKEKHKVKDKKGTHTEVHVSMSSQPWVAAPAAYAGTYEVEGSAFKLTVEALSSGQLGLAGVVPDANGAGSARPVKFSDVRVQDGWLTATKTDESGVAQPFTAAFLLQSRNGVVSQGLGTKLPQPLEWQGLVLNKLFYQKQK